MRILVTTPGHLRTAPMGYYCAETFRKLGHETLLFDAGSLKFSEKLFLRPIAKLRGEHRYEKKRLNQRLLEGVKKFRPDLFISIFGFDLFPETIAAIRQAGAHTVCWWLNDPFQFERGLSIAPAYDHFLSNCMVSAAAYQKRGIPNAAYLPHAAFTALHRPRELSQTERTHWESEVCFVGDWGPVRQGILSMLSQRVDLKIWGPWRKHLTKKDRLWSRIQDGYFSTDDMARAFSATKIAINLHSWFGYYDYGLNPRTFETPGCGALQICDFKQDLKQHFKEDEEIVIYRTGIELEGKIRELLADASKRDRIIQNSLKQVASAHTYEIRMKQMLDLVGTR
jgi:spore maturation protein CgeB